MSEIVVIPPQDDNKRKRVAAYCRVSTKLEEQQASIEAQIAYYTEYISQNSMWEFVGVFADKKSGLRMSKCEELQKLLTKCYEGEVDIIITKSISRFSRNLYDCAVVLRCLKSIGVDVWFENEAIKLSNVSAHMDYELFLIMAEAESEGKSKDIKFGIKHGLKTGKSKLYNRICYGYANDENGKLIINEYEAEIVIKIFTWYLEGYSLGKISDELYRLQIKSPTGKEKWSSETISKLLSNEKLTGNVVGQKTYVKDFHTGVQVKNNGEIDKYLIKNHHMPIISNECFEQVQAEKELRSNISIDNDGKKIRRTTRYSNDILSGRIICGECGTNYRRITRRNGEVIWKCANRVEKRICKESRAVTDEYIKKKVADKFLLYNFDEDICRLYLKKIIIYDEIFVVTEDFNENDMLKLREFQMKEAAVKGDKKALNTLYEETYRKIKYSVLRNVIGKGLSTHDKLMRDYEDVFHDTLLKSFKILHKYHGYCRFSTWVTKIAYYEICHKLKELERFNEIFVDPDKFDNFVYTYERK